MGVYAEKVLPRCIDKACGAKVNDRIRSRACAGLEGEVVELGFGSGLNVAFYPPEVARVSAVEPSDVAWRLAAPRRAHAVAPVERAGLDAESLPFADDSADAVLSTWTLCTVPDVVTALQEVRRVLKPGGTFHFAEHGLAPDASVARWQRRIEPLWQHLAGGCHLTREIPDLVAEAGFAITELDIFYAPGVPRVGGAMSVGVARYQ